MHQDELTDGDVIKIKQALTLKKASILASTVYTIENVMSIIKGLLLEQEETSNTRDTGENDLEVKPEPCEEQTDNQQHNKVSLGTISSKLSEQSANSKTSSEVESPQKVKSNEASRKRKHMPKQADLNSKEPLTCEHCGYQTTRKDHFKRHTLSHTNEKPFKCEECGYSFIDRWHLQRHLKSRSHDNSSKKTKEVECTMCDYKTDRPGRMERHLRTHSGEKPFTCSYCPYKAAQRATLSRHILTHTGEKPFKCPHCEYSAADTKSLKFHTLQKHTSSEVTQHSCSHCDYSTPVYRYFQLHMRAHSDARPYLCHICGYSAKRNHGLTKHYRSVHGYPKSRQVGNINPISSEFETPDVSTETSPVDLPLPEITVGEEIQTIPENQAIEGAERSGGHQLLQAQLSNMVDSNSMNASGDVDLNTQMYQAVQDLMSIDKTFMPHFKT